MCDDFEYLLRRSENQANMNPVNLSNSQQTNINLPDPAVIKEGKDLIVGILNGE